MTTYLTRMIIATRAGWKVYAFNPNGSPATGPCGIQPANMSRASLESLEPLPCYEISKDAVMPVIEQWLGDDTNLWQDFFFELGKLVGTRQAKSFVETSTLIFKATAKQLCKAFVLVQKLPLDNPIPKAQELRN